MNDNSIPVVILTWNAGDKLRTWLDTVRGLRSPAYHEIRPVVVDNASSDITPALIGRAISKGEIEANDVHWLPSNYGFAKAHNVVFRQVITRTRCRYVATLNEDATADSNWLASLVEAACREPAESHVGMWGGPIHCPAPKQGLLSSAGHWLRRRDAAFLDVDWNLPADSDAAESAKKDFKPFCPCFAAALWSVEMMKSVGLLDGDQFMYYDDVDLAYRARLADWDARYVPTAKAFHPLPMPKQGHSFPWRHQQKGRLAIVCRYLPDHERVRILTELPNDLRLIYEEMVREGRNLAPVGTPEKRLGLWNEWARTK